MPEAPRISIPELRGYIADAGELVKGTQIADGGALLNLSRHENKLFCEAKGSGQSPYRVSLTFAEEARGLTARCSCMAARSRPFCKHSAALLVSWARSPESFVVSEAPPVADGAAKKKSVKSGKASGADLMKHGVERVTTLVRELAVAGIAAAGSDRVDQVRQLGEALRENRLRRLSARTLELSQLIEVATARRGQVDAVAYADLLSDMLLTARRLEKHLAGQTLEPRYVEELVGKSWRKDDRTPVAALDLVEYAFAARVTADDFVIRESRFVDVRTGVHYSEKQILPAFLARRTDPKPSYAGAVLSGASGGIYPGFPPHRLDLEVPERSPLTPTHVAAIVEHAHASVGAALAAFQEHRKDVFAPDAYPVSVRGDLIVAEDGRFRAADATGEALHLPNDPRLEEAMTAALRRGRLQAIVGEMTIDGILATLTPLAFVLQTEDGLELITLSLAADAPKARPNRFAPNDGPPAWLEQARNAGVSAAAIALGEVRLEMADALVTGLASLVSRVTDPLAARLTDLGLDKPAAVLAELPAKPDPADRLDGFVKVHQIAGLALVRMAGATTIDSSVLERLPTAESIAIRRPATVMRPDELLVARLEGRLTRHEAMWHRAKQLEGMQIDELLTEWPRTWSDGEAAPFVAQRLASAGERAVQVATAVLNDRTAGTTAQLTALRVLAAVGSAAALDVIRGAATERRVAPVVRLRAEGARVRNRGWLSSLLPGNKKAYDVEDAVRRLTGGTDKDTRLAVLEELERCPREEMIPAVRQAWNSDPVADVRARAASMLGQLGDSDSVETLVAALRDRATAVREAKGAIAGLGALGDIRAVPEMLQALTENWAGSLPSDALHALGIAALEPVLVLTAARPDLAQRKSLQSVVERAASSPHALRLVTKHLDELLATPGSVEKVHAVLRVTGESEVIREAVAHRILAHCAAPADKAEKALVRAAQQAVKKKEEAAGGAATTGTAG